MTLHKWIERISSLLNDEIDMEEKVLCSKTNTELFTLNKATNHLTVHTSYGYCTQCNKPFEKTQLSLPAGIVENEWPVCYEGSGILCEDCFEKITTDPF